MNSFFQKRNNIQGGPISLQGGQAIAIAIVFFLVISASVIAGVAGPVLRDTQIGRSLEKSKDTYFLAEGLAEDIVYRLKSSKQVSSSETLSLAGNTATAQVSDILGGKRVVSSGDVSNAIRRVEVDLVIGEGASFNFGVQTDEGGFVMENTSSVKGNLFSNGSISGTGNNMVEGDVISAGPSGYINGIHATGTAYAHTIEDSLIEQDAYYQVLVGSPTILGTPFPDSEDQAISELPITDAQISTWESDATAGGVIDDPCPYDISTDMTIGPIKIECDFTITGNPTITLTGSVWVEGDFIIKNKPTIKIATSLQNQSVPIIADNSLNRITSSKIDVRNSTTFQNSGTEGSYILLLSMNEDALNGGSAAAITVEQSSEGDFLVYTPRGEVLLKNNTDLKEVTGWRVRLQNSTVVRYESGLANLLFTSGPGGEYRIDEWHEVE